MMEFTRSHIPTVVYWKKGQVVKRLRFSVKCYMYCYSCYSYMYCSYISGLSSYQYLGLIILLH